MADEMKAYDPTIRERIADQLQQSFEAMGANRYKARKRAQTVTGGPSSNLPLSMGLADVAASVNPAAAAAMLPMYTEEGMRSVEEAGHAAQRGDVIGAGVSGAVGLLELSPAAIGLSKILRNVRKLKPMDIPEVKPIEVRHAVGGAIDARRNRLRALLDDDSYAVGGEVRMRDGGDMEIPTEENIRRSQELIRKPVDRSLTERLIGGAEALGALGTSAAMTIPGMVYAVGTSRGKTRQQMEEEYRRFLERNTYMPRTEAGREYVQELGETLEPLGSLPPVTGIGPGAVLAQPAMRQTAGGLKAAARAGERFAEQQVPKIMERGGFPAELLQGLSENARRELIAYHGSPHKFEKFDASKIGTGEGAQAYGHGLYFAESPGVAKGYQSRLSGSGYMNAETGEIVDSGMTWQKATQAVQSSGVAHPDRAGAIASQVQDWVDKGRVARSFLLRHQVPKNLESAYEAAINVFQNMRISKGSFYTVDIPDEMIGKMLDWDKPLNKQPEEVRLAFKKAGWDKEYRQNLANFASPMSTRNKNMRGENLHSFLEWKFGGDAAKVSDELRKAGIPGIRYLDQGSRDSGKGTRNIVVFPGEESAVTIMDRYQRGGLAAVNRRK